tara:strand:+ start:113 stop:352 length:240 start_codon:yes stop_codon:yes gene_type:complete
MSDDESVFGCNVTLRSPISGKDNRMRINAPLDQVMEFLRNRRDCDLVQEMFPNLSSDEREFLLTGITPDEWNRVIGGAS